MRGSRYDGQYSNDAGGMAEPRYANPHVEHYPIDFLRPEFREAFEQRNSDQLEFIDPGFSKSTIASHAEALELENSGALSASEEQAYLIRDQMINAAGDEEIQFFAIYAAQMIVKLMSRAREIPEMADCMGQFAYGTLLARRAVTVSNNGGNVREAFGRHRLEKLGRLHEIASPAAVFAASAKV